MAAVTGEVVLSAAGRDYRLHLGFTGLAALQAKHGQDVFSKLEAPEDAPAGWVPSLSVIVDLVGAALQRHHAADLAADPYLVDDILSANPEAVALIMAAAFPSMAKDAAPGNRKGPKAAA